MKIKEGYLLRELADTYVVVPVGQAAVDLRGMITLNGTGAFLWKQLQTSQTVEALVKALVAEYDVDISRATTDVENYIEVLKTHQLLDDTVEGTV